MRPSETLLKLCIKDYAYYRAMQKFSHVLRSTAPKKVKNMIKRLKGTKRRERKSFPKEFSSRWIIEFMGLDFVSYQWIVLYISQTSQRHHVLVTPRKMIFG